MLQIQFFWLVKLYQIVVIEDNQIYYLSMIAKKLDNL